ncbi:MAG TPA: glycosyltransferase family 25 protein, partial [Acidimicrobiia bacterium]|nr:glycosyltransferase family 25 protein [Acidimicrobiia bacterium]
QRGRRTLCLPFLRWVHRFDRPGGTQYPNQWEDRVRNYLVGWDELGLELDEILDHFSVEVGAELTERVASRFHAAKRSPFWYFDAIYCINRDDATARWAQMQARFERLGLADRVRRFSAVETPESHHVGCALSHRRIVELANDQRLDNVLVFEDDAVFLEGTPWCLGQSLAELAELDWDALYLGGCQWGKRARRADGCEHLTIPETLTCTHAVAYHHTLYDQILTDVPAREPEVAVWCGRHAGIDQYLNRLLKDRRRYLTEPVLATQPGILGREDPRYRDAFTV